MLEKKISIFAPAKINLYLHVTGRRDDGYHVLDSLVCFADVGDQIEIKPTQNFKFTVDGPYASALDHKALDSSPHSSNLAVMAAWEMSKLTRKNLNVSINLTKNLPLGAGIGGGSSDAAAVIWGLLECWNHPKIDTQSLNKMMQNLGADIPVCLPCQPSIMRGTGDIIEPYPHIDETPIVLIYPKEPCSTQHVFRELECQYKKNIPLPNSLETFDTLIEFLEKQNNDLLNAACQIVPQIKNALNALSALHECALARMSGSGSTCYGLFKTIECARTAAQKIQHENPDWWVKSGWLNRPQRY